MISVGALPTHVGWPPSLIILSGLPGSGKSHFQRELRRRTGAIALESDALRKFRFGRPTYSINESAALFSHIRAVTEQYLAQGRSVIVDATNLSEWERQPYYRMVGRLGARLQIVRLIAPEPLIRERLRERGEGNGGADNSDAGPEVYELMRAKWQEITVPHTVVDTSLDIIPAVEAVAKAMET